MKAPKGNGFYFAKSKQGNWYTVLVKNGEYIYTSEAYGIENMPASPNEFVEWIKVNA